MITSSHPTSCGADKTNCVVRACDIYGALPGRVHLRKRLLFAGSFWFGSFMRQRCGNFDSCSSIIRIETATNHVLEFATYDANIRHFLVAISVSSLLLDGCNQLRPWHMVSLFEKYRRS